MVTRVGKFVGGLGQDITNTANAHATENRIAFGAAINPTANVHVVGTVLATTTVTATGGFLVPDDGDIGSASATDAMQISSAGIVTFKDDILIKDGGTIGTASAATAMTVASTGIVTFVDDIVLKDAATIGVTSSTSAISIAATGIVTFVDDIVLKDAATIGVTSSTSAISIAATGIVTFVDDILIKDAGTIGSASDPDAITIGADGDVTLSQDLELQHDAATISFGENDEIVLTHVHNTGLALTDTGGSPTLQLHDAGESISSDGSKLILTSNSVAFELPTADGSAGQVIKTDGSGALSFTNVSTSVNPATSLASSTDCGNLTQETNDAFGQIISDTVTVLNLLVDPTDALGTVDQGALS